MVLRTIADAPELYRVAKEIVMDRRKAQAFLLLTGEKTSALEDHGFGRPS
jgi:hypothetical protein